MEAQYKAMIVEDMPDTSDYIKQRLSKLCPDIGQIDQTYNLDDAYNSIINNHYDIVFLDIQLAKGTGFDLLKMLSSKQKIDFEIIFITGESAKEHTLRAIKYSALDFLYKPLDDGELVSAVHKATEKLKSQYFNRQIKLLLDRVGETPLTKTNKIAFHLRNGIVEFMDVNEIKYLRADGVISHIYLKDGETLCAMKNLGYYKDMLIVDYQFVPISNSVLVNQNFIQRYNHKELLVYLNDGTTLYASKRYGKNFKDHLNNNHREGFTNPLLLLWKKLVQ